MARSSGNEWRRHPLWTEIYVCISFFFVTAVSWGFVCLLTRFEDCLWDSVSWAFDDFVYMRVCLRVWHVCNSWCLCNGGGGGGGWAGWRPDGWGEWQELSALFCPHFFDLTNMKTVLLKYIHIYTFSCVCMFKTIMWQPLTLSCN